MKSLLRGKGRIAIVSCICLIVVIGPPAFAQKVPLTFDDFHGYTATVDYINRVAKEYPNITDLLEIGKSNKGRPIYVLIVTNKNIGTTIDRHVVLRNMRKEGKEPVKNVTPMKNYQGKPGIWVDGGMHGNEFTGTEVCLYIVNQLVSAYGSDPEITRLIDDNTFYVCPVVNPDGVFNSVEAGISQRQNSPEGVQEDPRINDLNGDGLITLFRYKDPKGRYFMDDKDPRVMIRLGEGQTTTRERYSVVQEAKDPEDNSRRGIDVNRNFPEGWFKDDGFQRGSGYYPSSSPEAHAMLEFLTNNTNILLVQSFHTSGGFTYRPLARWPDSRMSPKDVAIYDRVMGRKYLELIGDQIPPSWNQADIDGGLSDSSDVQQQRAKPAPDRPADQARGPARSPAPQAQQPRGWRHPYNDVTRSPYGYGVFLDWAYAQFGAWSMSTELWNWQKDTKGLAGYAGEDDRGLWESAYIRQQEKDFGGKRFVPWKKFVHPKLGEGEVGGWVSKYNPSNAIPGETLLGVCDNHWQFELYKAKLLPRIEITDAKARVLYTTDNPGEAKAIGDGNTVTIKRAAKPGKYRVIAVTATIENKGELSTQVDRGERLRGNREDVVWLIGDRKVKFVEGTPWMKLGVIDGIMKIPSYEARAGSSELPGGEMERDIPPEFQQMRGGLQPQIRQTGSKREVSWLVAVEGDTPLKVVVTSQKGGTRVKELTIQ